MSEGNISLPSTEALQSMIGTLISNPALMKGIAGALGNAVGNGEENNAAEKKNSETETKETDESVTSASASLPAIPPELISKLPVLLSLFNGGNGPKSKSEADREALLCALKPFLSPSRAETVDKIIKLSRLGDILTKL